MQAAEVAVRHDGDVIAGPKLRCQRAYEAIDVTGDVRSGADLCRHVVERPGEIRRLIQPGAIGCGERFGEAGAMRAELTLCERGSSTAIRRAARVRSAARLAVISVG